MRRAILVAVWLMTARGLAAQAPNDSRAVFRMASAKPQGSAESIALLERYVRLEPDDAWGFLALSEAQAAARRFDAAWRSLERAQTLAPGEEDVKIVRQRIQRLHRNSVPTMQPRTSYTRDSDANHLFQTTMNGDLSVRAATRFGFSATHAASGDDFDAFTAAEARVHLNRRSATTRLELSGGAARVSALADFATAVGRARLRIAPKATAGLLDLRVARAPLLASPLLMVNQVVLTEARGTLELPIATALRLRANAQLGDLASADIDTVTITAESGGRGRGRKGRDGGGGTTRTSIVTTKSHNTRVGLGAGLVMRTGASAELSASYYQLSYDSIAKAGYFAPRLVQLLEAGTYQEIYKLDPVTVAFDVGAGVQRSAEHGGELGQWKPAFRAWALLTVPLARAFELNVESDFYKSQMSTVSTSSSWSSVAGAVSVKWLVGY